ncbi:LysR substrate-binding domain-containing protein [Arenimonas sp.]|uniref:LysR substrate-binding domain-containing protein n=1 Tax=Arenimonas sp. TaxID=1872635 RepID=UPI0039E5A169
MPSRRQPLVHLNALRAFEAAARLSSFAAAAEELNVTASAISQQIRTLEEYLGVELFLRTKAGIALTPPAREAYADVRDGLARLAAGLGKMKADWQGNAVALTAPTSFVAKWLLPRMEAFRRSHPDIDLRIDTSDRLADYAAEGIDLGVRYGRGGYGDVESTLLFREEVFPVCSPALIPDGTRELPDEAIDGFKLIHDATIAFDPGFPDWPQWLAARGLPAQDVSRGLHFNSSVLATQAAIEGQGVVLGRSIVVEADLRAGRLVRPFAGSEPTDCAYYLLHPPGALDRAAAKLVHDWLMAESRQ